MDTKEPIVATPTDGHAAGIVDELSSTQQLSAGGAGSNTGSGDRGRPRGRRSRGGGCPRQRAISTPVYVVQGLGVVGRGVLQGAAIRRTPKIPTDVTFADQTIRLHLGKHPGAPGHLASNPRNISHSTSLHQITQY